MEASEERQVILQLPPNTKFPKSRIASELELTQNATPLPSTNFPDQTEIKASITPRKVTQQEGYRQSAEEAFGKILFDL